MPVANNLSTVCILLGDLLTGQQEVHSPGTDFATTTFGVAALGAYENDYFNQWFGRTLEGTHRNTNFIVRDFVKTNGVVTVEETAAVAYDASDRFFMVPDYPIPELIRAINLAITTVEHEALEAAVDDNLVTVAAQFEYDVPPDFHSVEEIFLESGTADRYRNTDRIDTRHWTIKPGSEPKLWFDADLVSLTAGRNLRVVGQKVAAQLVDDDDLTLVPMAFLLYQAKANVHFGRIDDLDDSHDRKMALSQVRADSERVRVRKAARGLTVNY